MKVFATLATILGVSYATPEAQTLHQVGSTRSNLQQHNNVMGMSTENIMSNMRMVSPYQAQAGPRQYHLQDEFGNFEYAYANQNSEKMEKGNDVSVRGQYAYIMSDGMLRRVDYIADNNGFHLLQDNADSSKSQERIKRSVEPDLFQTRMTSFMDSSSLNDNSKVNPNMHNLMLGQDMSNNRMQRNRMNQMSSQPSMYDMMDRSSNMQDKNLRDNNMMGLNMIGLNMMDENMMGRNMDKNMMDKTMMDKNMMGRNLMDENMIGHNMMDKNMMSSNMMVQNMRANMMGRGLPSNTMNRHMISQDSNMRNRNMMSQETMQQNYSNMMGPWLMGRDMSSSLMDRDMMVHGWCFHEPIILNSFPKTPFHFSCRT